MRLLAATLFVALALGGLASSVHAAEPYGIHDAFGVPKLDVDRWQGLERTRVIRNGALNMIQRDFGGQLGDSGYTAFDFPPSMSQPSRVTQMRAALVVNDYVVTSCPGMTETSVVSARVGGYWFNAGPAVAGSHENDVLGIIRVSRSTASAEPAGVLNVEGVVVRCRSADCSTVDLIAQPALGTVAVGTPVSLRIDWDAPGHRFIFRRDSQQAVTVPYTLSDALPPSLPSKDLSTRTRLAQCFSGPRTEGAIDVRFDNVQVNASGLP